MAIFRYVAMACVAIALALPAEARDARGNWVLLGEQTVGFRIDRDIVTISDGSQRFSQLRIESERNDVYINQIALVYQNGYREEFRVDKEIKPGQNALPIQLNGARSFLKQIELVYRARPSFEGRAVVRIYGELQERWRDQNRTADRAERGFDVIGTETISRDNRRVRFDVGRREGRFVALRFKAEDGAIRIEDVRITFGNGETQKVAVDERLGENEMTAVIDLEGDKRAIRDVVVEARPRRGEGRARLTLLGRQDERRGRDEPRAERGFDAIGTETVSRDNRRVRFDVGRREGRFVALRFKAEDGAIRIEDVRITFGNGETQKVAVDERLGESEMTAVIDLEGEKRAIRDVVVEARPRRGAGRARLTLLGRQDVRRGGDARRDDRRGGGEEWVTLGRQNAAMFKADTDMFRVGRDAGVFRAVRVAVEGSNVKFFGMVIKYGNGETEDVPLVGEIRAGQVSQAIDLKGRDRFIDSVTFKYRAKISLRGPARIEVQGLRHGAYRGR
ncbi:MAG: hypothetical protein KDJ37_02515 [Hyphomicrobiaceae bacterium]|nr:hypothetical protein [Hyphomicrobiaceae bacterium]